eukprot:Polyplicarium_translucidae@DN3007_c0_g2_i1.p1
MDALTRHEVLAAMHDESIMQLPPFLRVAWKSMHGANPLATFLLAQAELPMIPRVPPTQGLLALPRDALLRVGAFAGQAALHGRMFSLSRTSAAIARGLSLPDSVVLAGRIIHCDKNHRPTLHELYRLHWKIEKLLALRGFCVVQVGTRDTARWIITDKPLFYSGDLDWKSLVTRTKTGSRNDEGEGPVDLPRLRSLTIPAAADLRVEKASARSQLPSFPPWKGTEQIVRRLKCPNLVEFYAPDADARAGPGFEDFFVRHRDTLKVFVAPTHTNKLRNIFGHITKDFPFEHIRDALGDWQYVESNRQGHKKSRWPAAFERIHNATESVKAASYSFDIEGREAFFVSLPASLAMGDLIANIRAMGVCHRSACRVLAKVGELRMRLFYLVVAPCACQRRCAFFCQSKETDIARGLQATDKLGVGNGSAEAPPVICKFVLGLLESGEFYRRTPWHHEFTRKNVDRTMAEEREARLSDAIVRVVVNRKRDPGTYSGQAERRVRAWCPVNLDCSHHRVFKRIAQDGRINDISWYVKDCRCNLSWNHMYNDDEEAVVQTQTRKFRYLPFPFTTSKKAAPKEPDRRVTSLRSAGEQMEPDRARLERQFEEGLPGTDDGLWQEAAKWMRGFVVECGADDPDQSFAADAW